MKNSMCFTIAGAALLVSQAATAQQREIGYPEGSLGVQAIMSDDYATAERQLQDFRVQKTDPGRLINLGVVSARTGRTQLALDYFTQVLDEENVELILADGKTRLSHDIARTALQALNGNR